VLQSTDATLTPTLSLDHLWRNSAGLTWQPLGMLNTSADLTSTRDLRIYPDSSSLGRLAYAERRFLLGIPVGVERDRALVSTIALTPVVASWLRPRLLTTSNFVLSRTLTSRAPVRADEDSGAFILPQTLNNSRTNELGSAVDIGRALRLLVGESSGLGRALVRVRPVDLSTRITRTSTYDLTAFDPSLGYQLALGGLGDFLSQNGSAARGVSEARVATLAGGADLPYGVTLTLSHALTRTTRFQQVGDGFIETETDQREWPVGSLRWSHTFPTGTFSVLSVGTAIRRRRGSSQQINTSGNPALTSIQSSSISPDVQIGFRNGLSMTAGVTHLDQDNLSNGNETRLNQTDLTSGLTYAFRLPRLLSRTPREMRSSFSFLRSAVTSCLQQLTTDDCVVISDVRRHEVRAGLDTDLLQTLSGGLQLSYSLNDARELSRKTSQISIIASFQLSLFAGDYH